MFSVSSERRGEDSKEDARGMEGEKEIRQKKRGDARWMRFHRGRRDAVCALLKKVSGATERKHTEDASSNVGGGRGRRGRERRGEGSCDAGRPVIAP